MSIRELDRQYVANTYKRFPVEIVSGKGSVVRDTDGREYIDMGSGIAVTSFGVADEIWQKAVIEQIGKVQHTSNLYYTEPCAKLAEALCTRTGMKKVFFSNSGAEANECMIKAARKWAAENKGADCFTIATLKNSFHGRTLTTLAATGQAHYHELFQPLTPGFVSVDAGSIAQLDEANAQTPLAAVMIECIQGEGGVVPLDPAYAKALSGWTKKNDVLLLIDEVQTGNGRTGALYAYMNYGFQPDAASTAKGLAGGLPLGATLLGERLEGVLGYGDHGSTFGGNPVACAAALSVLGRIDADLLADVRRKSRMVFEALDGAPGVEAVSGMGLMIGVKCAKPAAEIVTKCIERGVLFLTAKDKVRLLPALNIPDELLMKAVNILKEAAAE
ncbi:MAG: aminotransferase class III-fold pyridoxal phosphate-dependent enzyme [Clostridiales bacterium]|nr:aminotransferase class III-fold pyridoxal phosphate-dependent enzyme [Clostridiales bacterium]